jgi:hypothetical protein
MTCGDWQLPATHEYVAGQALPHEPQFFGSFWVFSQTPLHSV